MSGNPRRVTSVREKFARFINPSGSAAPERLENYSVVGGLPGVVSQRPHYALAPAERISSGAQSRKEFSFEFNCSGRFVRHRELEK